MPNVFTLVGDAWEFYRKHPVLNSVVLWLYVVPGSLMNVLITLLDWVPDERGDVIMLVLCTVVILSIVLVWGSACVLLVARRTVKTSVGRTRTSFQALRQEASTLIVPLLLTGILQVCFTILWGLLLIVPGVVYQIRTGFYHVVVVAEGKQYRAALRRSTEVVRGQTWQALGYMVALSVILYLPVNIISVTGWTLTALYDPRLIVFFDILDASMNGIATTLFLIATVSLYGTFQKRAKRIA